MKKINWVLCYGLVFILFGCATANKVEPPSRDSLELAVAEVVGLKTAADIDQAELLSFKEYMKGTEYLGKAQRGLAGNYEADYILDNAAKAKAQLQEALKNTQEICVSRSSRPGRMRSSGRLTTRHLPRSGRLVPE